MNARFLRGLFEESGLASLCGGVVSKNGLPDCGFIRVFAIYDGDTYRKIEERMPIDTETTVADVNSFTLRLIQKYDIKIPPDFKVY